MTACAVGHQIAWMAFGVAAGQEPALSCPLIMPCNCILELYASAWPCDMSEKELEIGLVKRWGYHRCRLLIGVLRTPIVVYITVVFQWGSGLQVSLHHRVSTVLSTVNSQRSTVKNRAHRCRMAFIEPEGQIALHQTSIRVDLSRHLSGVYQASTPYCMYAVSSIFVAQSSIIADERHTPRASRLITPHLAACRYVGM